MDNILDKFDETPVPRWFEHWTVVYIPTGIFILGLAFRFMLWPFSSWMMGLGLILMLIRSCIFFFSKRREFGEWAYFTSRVFLITTLIGSFIFTWMPSNILKYGLAVFGVGILLSLLTKKKTKEEPVEQLEDDY